MSQCGKCGLSLVEHIDSAVDHAMVAGERIMNNRRIIAKQEGSAVIVQSKGITIAYSLPNGLFTLDLPSFVTYEDWDHIQECMSTMMLVIDKIERKG